jgi:hypothetical protein
MAEEVKSLSIVETPGDKVLVNGCAKASGSVKEETAKLAENSCADPAVLEYAQWLAETLNQRENREAELSREIAAFREATENRETVLSREIAAVREATSVGTNALIELRSAVQLQLEGLLKQVGRLEQDHSATKIELAEVVNEHSSLVCDLRTEMEGLREDIEMDIDKTKTHFHEMQVTVRQSLENQLAETRQFIEHENARSEAMHAQERGEWARDLENRLVAGKQETMDTFHRFDETFGGTFSKIHEEMLALRQAQAAFEHGAKIAGEEQHRVSDHTRKLQEELERRFQDQLEPRVYQLEDNERLRHSSLERMQEQIKTLLASRHPSPAESQNGNAGHVAVFIDNAGHNEEPPSNTAITPTRGSVIASAIPDPFDDNWRFSHSPGPDATQTRPEIGQSRPEAGQSRPEAGQSRPEAGQSRPEAGQSRPEIGQSRPDTGQSTAHAMIYASNNGRHPSANSSLSRPRDGPSRMSAPPPQQPQPGLTSTPPHTRLPMAATPVFSNSSRITPARASPSAAAMR